MLLEKEEILNYLEGIEDKILECENLLLEFENIENIDSVNLVEIKRMIHTVKGSARSYGFGNISTICHNFEDNLSIKNLENNKDLVVNQSLKFMDLIKDIISKFQNGEDFSENETNQKIVSIGFTESDSGHKALIVEKSRSIIKATTHVLDFLNIKYSIVSDPITALNRVLTEPFDSIILSNQHSELSGENFIRMLRGGGLDKKGLHTILLSGSEMSFSDDKLAPHSFFVKSPKLPNELKALFEKLLGKTSSFSSLESKELLFIDDDPDIHMIIKISMKKFPNIKYYLGFSSDDAKDILNKEKISVVISDFNLVGETGESVFKVTREYGEDIPFIFLTAESDEAEKKKLIDLGSNGVIEKPIKPNDFLKKINDILVSS